MLFQTVLKSIDLFRTTVRNPALRSHAFGFLLFVSAELLSWTGMLIYAHQETGPEYVGLIVVARLVPAALLAPFVASIADRLARHTVLIAAFGLQAITIGGIGVGVIVHAQPEVVYAFAILSSITLTLTRPVHGAILPELASEPRELVAANGLGQISEGLGTFLGPLILGAIISRHEPVEGETLARQDVGGAFLLAAGALLVSAVLSWRAVRIAEARGRGGRHAGRPTTEPAGHGGREPGAAGQAEPPAPSRRPAALEPAGLVERSRAHLLGGINEVRRDRDLLVVMALLAGRFVLLGGLEVALVLVSIDLLGAGEDSAGFLMSGFGIGMAIGGGVIFALAGRQRLAPLMGIASLLVGLQLAALGTVRSEFQAIALLAVGGMGLAILEAVGATLLQRIAPDDVLARVFGVLQAMLLLGQAYGALIVGPLAGFLGIPIMLLVLGLLLPIVSAIALPRFGALDRRIVIPVEQIAALRSLPLFAALPGPTLEWLARHLRKVHVDAGETVIRQGEPGDDFYLIIAGEAEVTVDGEPRPGMHAGDSFGEIALLRDIPRTATVTARTGLELYAVDRETFLAVVLGDPAALVAASRIATERARRQGAATA